MAVRTACAGLVFLIGTFPWKSDMSGAPRTTDPHWNGIGVNLRRSSNGFCWFSVHSLFHGKVNDAEGASLARVDVATDCPIKCNATIR
jgi:hypothetical protein